jgi:phage tail sheath gpL-like
MTDLAVDPNTLVPGTYLTVNLLRGASSAGAQGLKVLILSPPQTGVGDLPVDVEARAVFSKEDVQVAQGRSLGYFAYQAIVAADPNAQVELISVTESLGAAATQTLTFGGTPTADETWEVKISGIVIQLSRAVGDSDATAKAAAVTRINGYADQIFALSSAGSGGVVNVTANSKGPAGNDVTITVKRTAGAGGTLVAGGSGNLAGGTTEPDFTTALATARREEYDYILPCVSNAEANGSGTNNVSRLMAQVDSVISGRMAKLQQVVVGSTSTTTAAMVGAIARNHTNLEHANFRNSQDLPCEVAGVEIGDRMQRRRRESNSNRVNQPLPYLRGSKSPTIDTLTDPEAQNALANGVTPIVYTANKTPMVMRSITTHSLDTTGNPDRRCFDVNEVDALYDYAKDARTAIPQEFQSPGEQVKIAKDREPGDEALPAGVVEERDIRSFWANRTLSLWVPKGVIDGVKFQASIDAGTYRGTQNADDDTQFDLFIPASVYKILAKIGIYIAKVS